MTVSRSSTEDLQPLCARAGRWIALLAASVLLHVMAFNWADGRIGIPSFREQEPPVVTTALLAAPAPEPVITKPKPKARPRRPVVAPLPPNPPPVIETVEALPLAGLEAPDTIIESAIEPVAADPAPSAEPETAEGGPAPEPSSQTVSHTRFDPPPSAELAYDVYAWREKQKWYGSGMFRWEANGSSYSVTGEANVSFIFKISILNFKSEGTITGFGIAPVLYSEKLWRKPLTNTHFQHDNHKISFSASTATYPYNGGEQDRASIMWQLAGIGRGDPGQFQSGAEIDVMVAGARDAETWRIQIAGEEEVDTPYGKVAAWHVVRAPRAGSYDQKIDIWLAPQQEWYPVKVRYTYANGDYLDLALSELTPAAAR